jgi:hypothetical protein
MASFKNRIGVPKIKQPSLPISTILRQDQAIRVSHAPCMSHGIIEVLKENWISKLIGAAILYYAVYQLTWELVTVKPYVVALKNFIV